MLRLILATVHLLALGIGLGAVWARARALGGSLDAAALRRAFAADGWWGIAAMLWIASGLWRLLAGTEKATSYYMHNRLFFTKMGLFILVLVLEAWPMATLIRWRVAAGRTTATRSPANPVAASWISMISYVEAALVALIVLTAVAMARGYGVRD